jgi:Fe-S oxidoreductase
MAAHSPDLVMEVYAYLRSVYPDVGLFGNCCAHPALVLEKGRFARYQEILERRFREAGVNRVIVCCPNCAVTLKRVPGLEVVSIWQVLRRRLPEPKARGLRLPPLVLHDPCPSRNDPKVQEAAREVLSRLGVVFEEYPDNRGKTLCCGRANMLMVLEPAKSREVLLRRVSQSERDVLTYCFSCVDAFKSAGRGSLHGLDYVFAPPEKIDMRLRESLGKTWRNRRILAKRIASLRSAASLRTEAAR